jgi:hypothetical protein
LAVKRAQRSIKGEVDKVTHRQRIEDERIIAVFGRSPMQAIAPDKPEGIA